MDVHCCNCGEPWDQYHLRHDLPKSRDEIAAGGWEFGSSRLVVLCCPACPKDGSALPGAKDRSAITQQLVHLLGDDEDGLASTLEDFGL